MNTLAPFKPLNPPSVGSHKPRVFNSEDWAEHQVKNESIVNEQVVKYLDESTKLWENMYGVKQKSNTSNSELTLQENNFYSSEKRAYAIGNNSQTELRFNNFSPSAETKSQLVVEIQPQDATFNQVSQKWEVPETRVMEKPNKQEPPLVDFKLFGEFVVDSASKVTKTAKQWVSETKKAWWSLLKNEVLFKLPKKDKTKKEKEEPKDKPAAPAPQIMVPNLEQKRAEQQKRAEVNKKLGLNESFEGSVVNGQIRIDLEQALTKKEAEIDEETKKRQKQEAIVAMGTSKGKRRPGQKIDDMNLATEKQSHWSKAIS